MGRCVGVRTHRGHAASTWGGTTDQVLRRRIVRRSQLVRGRTRARNQVHAIVIRNLGRPR